MGGHLAQTFDDRLCQVDSQHGNLHICRRMIRHMEKIMFGGIICLFLEIVIDRLDSQFVLLHYKLTSYIFSPAYNLGL